ncbi:MAG: glycosyltransferase [Neptunomonas phycophila]|uniref:glycosyltransferase n=1 Tax=Neptunomonas phycophila TaxID=1572645 RepID=UPI003B8C376A
MLTNRPLKLVVLCAAYPPHIMGGGEISTQTLTKALLKAGHDVTVLTLADEESRTVESGLEINRLSGVNHYWVYNRGKQPKFSKLVWQLRDTLGVVNLAGVRHYLQEVQPDVVITSTAENLSARVWQVAHSVGCKVVHVTRSYYLTCRIAAMYKHESNCDTQCIDCRCFSWSKKHYSHYVDAVVGISNYVLAKHLELGYFPNAINDVIYNICFDKFIPPVQLQAQLTLGYIGRIHPTKGIEDIVNALALCDDKTTVRLLIAGDGDTNYTQELSDLMQSKGLNHEFLGHISPGELLRQINWLIVPSKWGEPFGRVVVEAAAHGVPVLGSHYGGIPELLNYGLGVVYRNPDHLAELIQSIQRGDLTLTVKESDLAVFSERAIVAKWEALLQQLTMEEERG